MCVHSSTGLESIEREGCLEADHAPAPGLSRAADAWEVHKLKLCSWECWSILSAARGFAVLVMRVECESDQSLLSHFRRK